MHGSGIDSSKTRYRIGTTDGNFQEWKTSNEFSDLIKGKTYYVQTKVTDNAGNTTISNSKIYIIENELPNVTIQDGAGFRPVVKLNPSTMIATTENLQEIQISNETIRNDLGSYLGNHVKWHTNNNKTDDIEWKILYADEDGTYLIASDFVKSDQIPNTKNGNSPEIRQEYTEYYFELPTISDDYTGIENSAKIENWYTFNGSTAKNSKCVDYMLDIDKWNELYSGDGLEWAIGGPTMEMANAIQEKIDGEIVPRILSEYGWIIDPNGEIQSVFDGSELMYINGRIKMIFGYLQESKPKNVYMAATGNDANSLYVVNIENSEISIDNIYTTIELVMDERCRYKTSSKN